MADASPTLDAADASEVVVKARGGNFAELGSTGLRHSGGWINEEFLRALQGDRALRVHREMADNDPVVGAMLFAVDMLVRQVEWRVEAPEANSVEEIVAARQEDRARAIQAAQAADLQRQQQEQAAAAMAEGKKPDGTPLPTKDNVKKALDAMGLPDWMLDQFYGRVIEKALNPSKTYMVDGAPAEPFWEAVAKRDGKVANDPGAEKGKDPSGSQPASKTPPPPSVPKPGEEIADPLDPKLQGDPAAMAEVEGEDIAVFVETCLHDMSMSWEDTLSTILSMLPYGWHTAEIVYKKRKGSTGNPQTDSKFDDGKIGWRYLPPRSQDTRQRWDIDPDDGSIKGMWQFDPSSRKGLVYLPIEKLLLFRTENRKGSPEGRSILRSAYRPWFFKKRIEEIEGNIVMYYSFPTQNILIIAENPHTFTEILSRLQAKQEL